MNLKLAYLSRGKLFFKQGDLAARQIESEFGQDIVNRSLQRQQRNEWKTQSANNPFSGAMLWGMDQNDPRRLRVAIGAVSGGTREGELLFALETDAVGGLFVYDWDQGEEKRLFHREALRARDLDVHPENGLIVCARHYPNGQASIAIVRGNDLQAVTEGDSIDEAPTWIPGAGKQLVFQSAGIGRNQQGYAVGISPIAIQRLDLQTGSLATVLENPAHDFLQPHLDATGNLYFIRRPYEALGRQPYTIVKAIQDVILFPFRLLRAIFHWLNFMSLVYSRKPLTTAAGPKVEGDDAKTLILRGRIIDAEKAVREGAPGEASALVPPTWELVKRNAAGGEQVLAKSVVAFDLDSDGHVVYTNGTAVYGLEPDSTPQMLFKGKLIENLVIVK